MKPNKAVLALLHRFRRNNDAEAATKIKKDTLMSWASGRRKPGVTRLKSISKKTGLTKEQLRPDIFGDG